MLDNRLAGLMMRKICGEATAGELRELHAYLQQHPEDQYFLELLSGYWMAGRQLPEEQPAAAANFQYILQAASEGETLPENKEALPEEVVSPRKQFRFYRMATAAAAAVLLAGSLWWLSGEKEPVKQGSTDARNEIVAKRGSKLRLLLPDDTHVWLNADSRLTYKNNFNDSLREVELEGEAFFNVVKDPARPFVVHTTGIDIKVLGTEFNVKSYAVDSTIEATLLRGVIAVSKKNAPGEPGIILKPHEKLVFNKGLNTLDGTSEIDSPILHKAAVEHAMAVTVLPEHIPDSARIETSWVYDKLLFDGDNFRELAEKMERWFNVKIRFQNDRVAAYRFRGVFEDENIEQALKALQLTASFHFKIKNNEVLIY